MENKRSQGKIGEGHVATYLRSLGYKIIERNYTIQGGEIDIVTFDQAEIVFVEVKSLQSESFIKLEETISQLKKAVLIRACQTWLAENQLEGSDWRIDFVGIVYSKSGKLKKLKHIKNAIY